MKKVLVVDDDKNIQELIKYNLKARGYEVITASNGEEGMQMAGESPDLILLDLNMPRLNGHEATRRLKADAKTKAIPIIMLTGDYRPETIEKAFAVGAIDYLSKPFSPATLVEKIEKSLK